MEKKKLNHYQIKNEEGHVGLLFLLLISFVAILFLYFSFSVVKTHKTIQLQMEASLCFQTTVKMTKDLTEKIILSNKIIKAAYISKNIPGPHVQFATLTHTSTQLFQQAYYGISIVKLLRKKSVCSFQNIANSIKNLPLRRKSYVILVRDLQGRAIFEDKKWTLEQSVSTKDYIAEKITMLANFKIQGDLVKVQTQWKEDSLKLRQQFILDYSPF